MNRIKITLLALAALMATSVAMSGCGSVCQHMDNDQNQFCDICGASLETVPETVVESESESETESEVAGETETEAAKWILSEITVKDQYGTSVAGAVLQINDETNTAVETVTTGSDGTVELTLAEGSYTVIFMELPEYHLGGTAQFSIKEGDEFPVLEVTNNTPDGSEAHPFFISTETQTTTFAAGETVHYTLFAGDRRSIVIENAADIEITVNDVKHTPDANGIIRVPVTSDQQQNRVYLAVTSQIAQDVTIHIETELGASDNPIVLEELGTVTATVPKDTILYYAYTVTNDTLTTLSVRSDNTTNNISLTNHTTSVTTQFTNGSTEGIELEVKAGDVVTIAVSVLDGDANLESYTLEFILSGTKG